MHDGCSGQFLNGQEIAKKIKMMGFDAMAVPVSLQIACGHCHNSFEMKTMLSKCPACGMIYAVTPCHAHHAANVLPAGFED